MSNYLDLFPQTFLEDIVRNRCVPFIGSGFSKNIDLPDQLTMPDWNELAQAFEKILPGKYNYNNPIDVLSAFQYEYDRTKLIEKLSEFLFVDESEPGETHQAFCKLQFELVVTSNFDFLLEKGYDTVHKYYRPLIGEEQLSVNNKSGNVDLVKFHGDLHHSNALVVVEEDYDAYLSRFPLLATFLANILISNTAWFIGYSLEDPDFRQLWQLIGDRLGNLKRTAYTLSVDAPKYVVDRFERRGVKVINLPGSKNHYPIILKQVFDELNEYWTKKLPEYSIATDEESRRELSLSSNSLTRLCFFDIALEYLSFYKTYIFPIAEEYGFKPITLEEILTPGDNLSAKLSSLFNRATVIILDLSIQGFTRRVGQLTSENLKNKSVLIVSDLDFKEMQIDASYYEYYSREENIFNVNDEIIEHFINWFEVISEKFQPDFEKEPRRLLEKNEYRSAVISAITLLEHSLKMKFDIEFSKKQRSPSMRKLIDIAIDNQLIPIDMRRQLLSWLNVRNKSVHSNYRPRKSTATKIVNGIYNILD